MNIRLQDHLRELKKEIVEIQDRHVGLSPDNAFVAWYLRAFIVDDEGAAIDALKGGSRDKGIDAVFEDHDTQTVFLVQGKYRQSQNPPPESRADVLALADTGRILCSRERSAFAALVNGADVTVKAALEKCRQLIVKRQYRLSLHFVTTGKVASSLEYEAIDRACQSGDGVQFEVHTRAQLLRRMQDYIDGVAPAVPVINLPIYENLSFVWEDDRTGIYSWIFSMRGSDLGKLCNDIGSRLFARNIRGYLGHGTNVNRGMEHTLKAEPQYFWYFNNGVTLICDDAREIKERSRKFLRVANAQIINGQQTTRTLALHASSQATLLVKVIAVPRDTNAAQQEYRHLVGEIVSATNWQNHISQADLKSNDIEQVRLERDLRKLEYQYLRKKMTKSEARRLSGNRYKMQIRKEELAQCVAACLLDPYEVRLGKDRLFEDDTYGKIFNGRSAADYLTFVRLHNYVRYCCRGDTRKGRAKWLVLNFCWSQLGPSLHEQGLRDKFLYVAAHEYRFLPECRPLYVAIDGMFNAAMAFYRKNKRTEFGFLDESTFFKHRGLHKEFKDFWSSRQNRRAREVRRRLDKFVKFLRSVEID